MSLEPKDLQGPWQYLRRSRLVFSKEKFFYWHIPLALSQLMGLADGDNVKVFVDLNKKIMVLCVEKGQPIEERKRAKK
jgi:uncharacterized membrane protein YobD (UPF0266 family)